MKKIILSIFCISSILIVMSFRSIESPCDAKLLKNKAKELLEPYVYDSAKLTKLQYKSEESFKEIEVPLFIGEKYRFVFNTAALPKDVEINVYNKAKDSKKRKLLFTNKDSKDKKEFVFEHSFASQVFIDYTIPAVEPSASMSGCVVFMVGYK